MEQKEIDELLENAQEATDNEASKNQKVEADNEASKNQKVEADNEASKNQKVEADNEASKNQKVEADNEASKNQKAGDGVEKRRFFVKYKIKDIVFLAIITACTLVTGAIMPLLVNVPLFGIIQLGLGLQFSLFPVIGMMKVRKPFALVMQSIFISIFLVFMFPPMAMLILCAVIAEAVALAIFRSYKNDFACVVAGTLYMPLTIPFLFLYYRAFYTVSGSEKAAVSMFLGGGSVGAIIGISIAAVAAASPDVLLLDEPTVGQDYAGLRSLVEILGELHGRTHNTMITVTHDMRCAEALCDHAVWIENGIVKAEGGKELAHTYFFERK